ncbi:MAG: hypothetical protein QOD69_1012 [Solirubrobacteraceae bacterium]|jgi:hypothetical protein|nr:hypothetical protein [Solirubrobacteraceae bacterium]
MTAPAGRIVALLALAVAGLALAIALGIVVSRAASQTVALGGPDLGGGAHLVAPVHTTSTPTTTSATAARPAKPRRHAPKPARPAPAPPAPHAVPPPPPAIRAPGPIAGSDDAGGREPEGDGSNDD